MSKIRNATFGLYADFSNLNFKKGVKKFFSQKMREKPLLVRKRVLKNFEKRVLQLENNLSLIEKDAQLLNDFLRNSVQKKSKTISKSSINNSLSFLDRKIYLEKRRFNRLVKLGKVCFEDFNFSKTRGTFSENIFLSKIHISYRVLNYLEDLLLELKKIQKNK